MTPLDVRTRVVMIVIDAMPHRYVDAELTPNLWGQVTSGGRAAAGGLAVPMSVTYANHAAFVTGVDPSVTGVYGNHTWIEGEGWVKSPTAGPRATTLFERIGDAGGRSVAVVGDHKLIAQMGAARADEHWPPDGWIPDGTPRCEFGYPSDSAVVAAASATDLDADLVVFHLNQPDTTSHLHGPDSPAAHAQYRATDSAYGELLTLLDDRWDDTVVITLSDHDQETIIDQQAVELTAAMAPFVELSTITDGTGALIHGPVGPDALDALSAVPGVEGTEQLSDDVWMTWTEPGRMFTDVPIPLHGQHGSPRCRTQLAIVSGGHERVPELVDWITARRPSALDWAPLVLDLLGLSDGSRRRGRVMVDTEISSFAEHGWLVLRGALDDAERSLIDAGVTEVAGWATSGGPGLHHFEQTDGGVVLARSEDFVPHHDALRRFICDGLISAVLSDLFGEPAVLFKEKINYKHPGGGGFAPHQDATAYRFVDHHISCMVPLDPASEASGCLHVASGFERGQLPTDERGRVDAATAATLDWKPVPLSPGDLLFFDSYTPHYSETNRTNRPRRAAYLTYNAASRGDFRDRYYADKRAEFAAAGDDFDGERVRISISDDFLGRPVDGST